MDQILEQLERYYTRFIHRACKLIDFIKLGWNDYDWDYARVLSLLDYKFRKMEVLFKEHGSAENSLKMAKVCRVLYKSLDKYNDVEYYEKYMNKKAPFRVKWGFIPSDKEGYNQMIWLKEDTGVRLTEEENEIHSKYVRRAGNFEMRMKKKYKRIFFRTFSKYLEKLWD